MKETYPNATRGESDHEIIKRFKEIIYKESEPIVEDELNQENTAFYKNKYFIIGALTISVLVSWYYFDEIKTGYGSVIDWLNSFRRGSSGGTSGIDTNESTTPIAKNIKSELNRLFPENPPKDIELIDNTQAIASSSKGNIMDDPTKVYSSSPTSMEQYFTEDKGKGIDVTNLSKSEINRRLIENATGNSLNRFQDESSLLLARLNQFTTLHETGNLPSEVLKVGMYNTLKARLVALSVDGGILYDNWLKESGVSEKVYNFFDLKDNLTNKVDEQHPDTYNDVALSTVQEQEAWSSGPNSSIHYPYVQPELITDEGPDIKVETPKNETKSLLNEFIQEYFHDDTETQPIIQKESQEQILQDDLQAMSSLAIEENQTVAQSNTLLNSKGKDIKVKTSSTGIFSNWMEEIKSRRKDEHVIDEANKESNANIETKLERAKTNPTSEETSMFRDKDKISAFLDKTNKLDESNSDGSIESIDHFLPNPEDIKPNIKIDSPGEELTNMPGALENITETPKSALSTILDGVKGFFSSKTENKVIEENLVESKTLEKYPSTSNLREDADALFDSDSDVDINWGIVKVENHNNSTKINFDDTWRSTKTVYFSTNNNHTFSYDFDQNWLNTDYTNKKINLSKTFNWQDKIGKDILPLPTEIKEIHIGDLNNKNHSIYKNPKWFK
jgi:hypothetical protein